MALTVWNVRGLNHPSRQMEVKKLLVNLKSEIFGLLETKIRAEKIKDTSEALGDVWTCISNSSSPDIPYSIWVGWRNDIWKGVVIRSHRQLIHLHMSNVGGLSFFLTVVYASNS